MMLDKEKLKNAFYLYLGYLIISILIWFLNSFVLGEQVSEGIEEFSSSFGPLIVPSESDPTWMIIARLIILPLLVYFFVFVIQMLTTSVVGSILYLLIAALVSLAAGKIFGGGLTNYLHSQTIFTIIFNQIGWFGGAVLLNSAKNWKDINWINFVVGVCAMAFSTFLLID